MFIDFFHRLLHPHCELCALKDRENLERTEDALICKSCEFLKLELAKERLRSQQLLDSILAAQSRSEELARVPSGELPEVIAPYKLWRVKQREMEAASRKRAAEMSRVKTTEELEKELNVGKVEKEEMQ
jgi:hypothetical protein